MRREWDAIDEAAAREGFAERRSHSWRRRRPGDGKTRGPRAHSPEVQTALDVLLGTDKKPKRRKATREVDAVTKKLIAKILEDIVSEVLQHLPEGTDETEARTYVGSYIRKHRNEIIADCVPPALRVEKPEDEGENTEAPEAEEAEAAPTS